MKSLHITYSRGKSLQFLQFESMYNNCNIHKGNMNKLVVVTYRSHYYKKRGKMRRRGKSTGGIHWQHPLQPCQLAVAWEKVTEINVSVAS